MRDAGRGHRHQRPSLLGRRRAHRAARRRRRLGAAIGDVLADDDLPSPARRRRPRQGPHADVGRLRARRAARASTASSRPPLADARPCRARRAGRSVACRRARTVQPHDRRPADVQRAGQRRPGCSPPSGRSSPAADILVVDDNSPDGTGDLVEEAAAELGQIKLLRRPGKQGLGSAYRARVRRRPRRGLRRDRHDGRRLLPRPGGACPSCWPLIGAGADAVIGSRYVPGGATVDWPLHRRLLSRWGNRYTSLLLGLQVRDCTSGFRAYRAEALRAIEPGPPTPRATPSSPSSCAGSCAPATG